MAPIGQVAWINSIRTSSHAFLWIDRSRSGPWDGVWWVLVFLVFSGFLFWSFWSTVTLAFRLFDRDAAFKEAIESDIWRSNVDQLREDLHKLEPHFIFHPNWNRSSRNTYSQPGHWHYCEPGGPTYKYFVKPRVSYAAEDWIHQSGKS